MRLPSASAGRVKRGYGSRSGANERMLDQVRVEEIADNHATRVDVRRECSLRESGACPWGIDRRKRGDVRWRCRRGRRYLRGTAPASRQAEQQQAKDCGERSVGEWTGE